MAHPLNLTSLSTTFPDLPEPQISRDNLVSLLRDRFGPERKVIIVQGPVGAGKTILLAQFAKTFSDRCFSFFVGTTLLTSHPRYFLLDLCEQMGKALGKNTAKLDQLDTDGLKQLFPDFYRKVAQEARGSKAPFYFVIDGLEWIPVDSREQTILELLPAEPHSNVYLLASSEPGRNFRFVHDRWDIPPFAFRDTELYLDGLGLSKDEIQRVHKSCQGMPGYLAAIRRLMASGVSFQELPAKLPEELRGLFEIEWARTRATDETWLTALAVLAYSREPLTLPVLGQIVSADIEELRQGVGTASFLRLEPKDQAVSFVSDAYKQFVVERLRSKRERAEELLVDYYGRDPYAKASLVLLPAYLAKPGSYEQLKSLVTTDYLTRALDSSRDIAPLRRTLQLAADQAFQAEDWQTLPRYTLASSILRAVSMRPVAEAEVEALLELGDYGQAFEVAYQALLPEDRLQLLARVCSRMQQGGLSAPENVIAELEQMAATIDPAGLRERAIEIAAVLFDLLPQAAIDLVERSAGEPSLDVARATLALRLETDSTELLRSRITDQSLRDFARANSPRVAKLTAEEVMAEAEKIKDTSGRLFLLSAWCNENRKNPSANDVVGKALEIITGDPSYAISMRLLRRLAEPLKASTASEVKRLIERLDLLKATAINRPAEEAVRLELLLASLEAKQSREIGVNRLLETYFSLDDIAELDVRCYCLARILISLPEVDPEDSLQLKTEVEQRLVKEYEVLLQGSAAHLAVTRRLLRSLTIYKPELALKFATKLNAAERRDRAFQEVLWVYADLPSGEIDLSFIEMVLNKISEVERRERALVRLIERFADLGLFADMPQVRLFLDQIEQMQDPRNQCYACAFALNAIAVSETNLVDSLSQRLIAALRNVDTQWERVGLGFDLATIVAKNAPEFARSLLEQTRTERATSPLAEEFFADIYTDCLQLALRAFSGVVASDPNYKISRDQFIQMIHRVPSPNVQCRLLADLALRHRLADKSEEFNLLVKQEVLPYFNSCVDYEARTRTLIRISACLFEYDPAWALEQLSTISPSHRDAALDLIATYLLTQKLPGDPVDLDSLRTDVDPKTARQICQVVEAMSYDSTVFVSINRLVDTLVQQDPRDPQREVRRSLIERDALDIAQRLERIASSKLPDSNNIQHGGYLIAAQAAIARLRAAVVHRTRFSPPWSQIAQDARTVPNTADKALVLACVGESMYRSDPNLAHALIKEAEQLIPAIPNILDRADRFYSIAGTWKKAGDRESAKMILREAMTLLQAWSWDRTRDQVTGQILQLAHALDPDFAAGLASLIDNPIAEHLTNLNLAARSLQHNPQRLEAEKQRDSEEFQHLLGETAWQMLESLNSGTGQIRHPKDVGQWLREAVDGYFEHSFQVIAWSVQNTLEQTKQIGTLTGVYQSIIDCLRLCMTVGQVLMGMRAQTMPIISLALPENVRLFRAGSRAEALLNLQEWLSANVKTYVKIYDPYFSAADLDILKYIDPSSMVFIVTGWKAQKEMELGNRGIEHHYRDAWSNLSKQPPPWTQITIIGTKSGDSPLHGRYIITEGKGLVLGTSIGGLGLKDSDLRVLEADEASQIETQFVNPQLGPQLRLYKEERLIVHVFVL